MIAVENLTKRRGARAVVSDVTFRCDPGTVTGFLGPNGAGKTTTLRMLVGLSEPESGQALLFGRRYRDLPNPARRVGTLLDASAQHAGRRGREALTVSARTMGVPVQRVDALLKLVGLDETAAGRRVGQYSLGMRQRLGFAHALLGDPEVLILDEPANGLDPEGTRAELLAASGTIVEAADPVTLDAVLHHAGLPTHPADGDRRLVEAKPEIVARLAMANDLLLYRLEPADGAGLERLFFELTATAASDPSPKSDPIHAELARATA